MARGTTMRRGVDTFATALRAAGLLVVAVLVVHVVLTLLSANPDNGLASLVRHGADTASLGLSDLFTPEDPKLRVALNYGTAALIWYAITAVAVRLVRRIP